MNRLLLSLTILFFCSISCFSQKEVDQDWNSFYQKIDVTKFRNCKFQLKAFVKVEESDTQSHALLLARVDTKKGIGFFDNMQDRPIVGNQWSEYVINGKIDKLAETLTVGGIYMGFGRYNFDNFSLKIEVTNSVWETISLNNPNFEDQELYKGWKSFFIVKGYESGYLIGKDAYEGAQSLAINGSSRSKYSYGNNKVDGRIVHANNIAIYYEEYGKGEPLLLLHGNSQSISAFKKQIPELSERYRVIIPDLRGQGKTTSGEGRKLTYELMADDINSLLNNLNLNKVNILGWSDGGNIGLILAMNYPEKVSKLLTMGANLFNDASSIDEKINREINKNRKTLIAENKKENDFKIQLLDLLINEPKLNPEQLKNIKCPTLIMAGSKDIIKEEHTKLIAEGIKQSSLTIFEGGSHFEPWENPKRFNATVIKFLETTR